MDSENGYWTVTYSNTKDASDTLQHIYSKSSFNLSSDNISIAVCPVGSKNEIGPYAFKGCTNISSITIFPGIVKIGTEAFMMRTAPSMSGFNNKSESELAKVTTIVFKGTKSQWEQITKGDNWKTGSKITTISCLDGDIKA